MPNLLLTFRLVPAVLALAWFTPTPASANGRAPATNGVFFRPGDANTLYVRSTFGLLVSHDDGCTFRWICEQNVGYGGTFDPKYLVATDGTIFATTFLGLRVSRDGGCTFTTATAEQVAGTPGRIAEIWVNAIDLGPAGEVWVGTADSGTTNAVYRSMDGGRTFEARGSMSPMILWKSIRVAPSDGMRVYAAGFEIAGSPIGHFYRSTDAGATWVPSPLTGVMFGTSPVLEVVGVDRTDADIVYLVSAESNANGDGDRLYRSGDGGATLSEVLATTAPIVDLIVRDTTVMVATKTGVYRSTDRGLTFPAPTTPLAFQCLGQREDGRLYACGANWMPDYKAIGRSTDGASWDKVFRFVELEGPVQCPAGTPQADTCSAMWPALQQQFGTTGPTCGLTPDAPAADATQAPSGGCCDSRRDGSGAIWISILVAMSLCQRRRARRLDARSRE